MTFKRHYVRVSDISTRTDDEALALVKRAFASAQASGRADWRTMSIAVLKNRLLELTSREFSETRWGATSMREFVEQLDPWLTLDATARPAKVSLSSDIGVDDELAVAAAEPARKKGPWRVRQDLWDAVINFDAGQRYVWQDERAVPYTEEAAIPDTVPVLPTATAGEVAAWRGAFAEKVKSDDNQELHAQFDAWAAGSTSSQDLPVRQRNLWFGTLKRHVVARLELWFATETIDPPKDWISTAVVPQSPTPDAEHLRAVLVRAVKTMTHDELRAVSLPATVIARLLR